MRLLAVLTILFLFSFMHKQLDDKLIWSDEFDADELNTNEWEYVNGNGCPEICGWGNNELQTYTNNFKNIRIANGKLIIEVHSDDSLKYTSAKIRSKRNWQYGRFEIKAKLPKGVGTWPAIWMLPEQWAYGDWPKSGEIDIMEHVGYDHGVVHGTVHTESFNHLKNTQKGKSTIVENVDNDFHVYGINWTEDQLLFSVDNVIYNQFKNSETDYKDWPFDQTFYMIFNIAVGGNWGGEKGVDNSIWPQKMEIDYIRIYEN